MDNWSLVIGYWSVAKEYFSPLLPAPCLFPIPVAEYWNKQTQ
ncbi:hypothetical protein NIES806_37920 [Dolichospermum compactum NIES-806]|uniref:Uncharacterized protein n=1 Tax=Dolichospermum compactum NIES-806 TaxID=1973481 RepID=A0A1Z4V7P3_9CYAN|nr:hypothetical protein NIES806_37920 [Dolichospermum compactum NIES-806]